MNSKNDGKKHGTLSIASLAISILSIFALILGVGGGIAAWELPCPNLHETLGWAAILSIALAGIGNVTAIIGLCQNQNRKICSIISLSLTQLVFVCILTLCLIAMFDINIFT